MSNSKSNLSYGEAIEAVKEGKLIYRNGWNGKGMYVFMRPEDELSINFLVHVVKSLPNAVKAFYANLSLTVEGFGGDDKITFHAYLCLKAADNSIVNGWTASQTDMLANDWNVLELQ